MSRFKVRQRLKDRISKTRLKLFETFRSGGQIVQHTEQATSNTTVLVEVARNTIDLGVTTCCAVYSIRGAEINLANGLADYANGAHGSLCLDCFGFCCNTVSTGVAFLSRTNLTIKAYAACTGVSTFTRTTRSQYKKNIGN